METQLFGIVPQTVESKSSQARRLPEKSSIIRGMFEQCVNRQLGCMHVEETVLWESLFLLSVIRKERDAYT